MQACGAAVGALYLHATQSQDCVYVWTSNKAHGQQRGIAKSNQTNEQGTVSTYSPRGCHGFGHMTAAYVKPWKGLAWHRLEPAGT